jgi:uncharacterized protein with ParB-like and HNH nuclease domain/predicted transport protein
MLAVQTNLPNFLLGQRQFVIPIYQRTYSWTTEQCSQLWIDVLNAARHTSVRSHFIGSVVYIHAGQYDNPLSGMPQVLVIDGQQRLTTLSLLLIALKNAIAGAKEPVGIVPEQIGQYLHNPYVEGESRYKLLLTQSDKETFKRLADDLPDLPEASPRLLQNLKFFADEIRKTTVPLADIFRGIGKLMLVDIALDRQHDNPQLIFESLNSTGLDLSQTDLIRNYVLMGLEPDKQNHLYTSYWHPLEKNFAGSGWFDLFVRDYLIMQTGTIPNLQDIYKMFKLFAEARRGEGVSIEQVVIELFRYSNYFSHMAKETEPDAVLRAGFKTLNHLRVDTARPFLLRAYADYETGVLSKNDFAKILRIVESYVFRRAVCSIPTNSHNKTFTTLYSEIDAANYVESIAAALLSKESYRRFPGDSEFVVALKTRDVYNFRPRNYLLELLENYDRRELVNAENYTIEHIMPQNPNLRQEWRNDLGVSWKEIQARLVHTIGNITLTQYNSELNDRPFSEKRDLPTEGFRNSPLYLNAGIGQLDVWDEAAIETRASRLAERATRIWDLPKVSDVALERYKIIKSRSVDEETTLDASLAPLAVGLRPLFDELAKRIQNLDSTVQVVPRKLYVAFALNSNIVCAVPQMGKIRLFLNIPFNAVSDAKGLCRDISEIGHWGTGDTEVSLASHASLDDVMALVKQAYEWQIAPDAL